MDRLKARLLLPVAASLSLFGCTSLNPQAPVDSNVGDARSVALDPAHVQIVNDPATLETRLTRTVRPLTVRPKSPGETHADKPKSERELGVRLTLVAEVAPPTVGGRVVQANDIEISGNRALVTFNFAGDPFAGAVQVIDFSRPTHPELESEVQYARADVNAIAMQGSHVFVGLAVDDPELATPAVVQELKLTGSRGLETTDEWVHLPSWAVTDLAVHGDQLVAAVGARDGGLVSMRRHDLTVTAFAPAADMRGVCLGGAGLMSVCGGPGRMLAHAMPSLSLAKSTSVDGYAQEYAKGTIEWSSGRCYLGTGDGGLQVRDDDGDMLAQLGNGEFSNHVATGVVNAVSVTNHLGFVAAGAAGVQVVRLGRYRCDGREAEDNEGLRVLGELELEDGASCNMVRARNDLLVVAGGAGGVKLITMEFVD
jgi:hypothetical protein